MNAKAEQNQAVDLDALVKRCDDCKLDENGLYKEMEELEDGGRVNAWVSALRQHPQLANRCNTFDKFRGYSICRLLEVQPQLVEKFDMEELCSPGGRYWQSDYGLWFYHAWGKLGSAQEQLWDVFIKKQLSDIEEKRHPSSVGAREDPGEELPLGCEYGNADSDEQQDKISELPKSDELSKSEKKDCAELSKEQIEKEIEEFFGMKKEEKGEAHDK